MQCLYRTTDGVQHLSTTGSLISENKRESRLRFTGNEFFKCKLTIWEKLREKINYRRQSSHYVRPSSLQRNTYKFQESVAMFLSRPYMACVFLLLRRWVMRDLQMQKNRVRCQAINRKADGSGWRENVLDRTSAMMRRGLSRKSPPLSRRSPSGRCCFSEGR